MADISKIKLPNNTTYDIKDTVTRTAINSLGEAAYKDFTQGVSSGSDNLVTSDAVYNALQGSSFTITKSATDCNLSYTARKLGNIVVINLKITTTSAWSTNSAKIIASVPSSVAPTSFQSVGFVTVGSLPSKHGAWLNTDYKIRMNVQEAIDSGKTIYITFVYTL